MSNIAWPNAITATSTTEDHKLGSTRTETAQEVTASDASLSGAREWIYVKAGAALAAGDVAEINAAATRYVVKPSVASADTHPMSLVGVASHAIVLNSYGWIVRRGEVVANVESSVSAGHLLTTSGANAGRALSGGVIGTDGDAVFGRALTAAAGLKSDVYVSFS